MGKTFNRIVKISIYLLIFLIPLFFLPFSTETFEFNKQYLLFFLVSLALFCWLAKMVVVDREIRFKRTPLDIPVLAFLLVAILSAVFSVDTVSSLLGSYGRFSDGLVGLISLGILYFLITNNVESNSKSQITNSKQITESNTQTPNINIGGLIKVFLWSVFFVTIFSYLSVFGVWAKIAGLLNLSLPQVMLQDIFNPVAGSVEGLAVFLAVVMVFLVGLLLCNSTFRKFVLWILLVLSMILLIIIDFKAAWIILFLALVLFLIFSLWKRVFREDVNKLLLPIFLIIIAAIFFVSDPLKNSEISSFSFNKEPILNQDISWEIGFKGATENVKSGFLGSGIGTFQYDFSKFKPAELNQTSLWQVRFYRAGNYVAEILATMGFLGIVSYLILIVMFFLISWFMLQMAVSKPQTSSAKFQNAFLITFLALLIAQFFYYQNTVLAFSFWLILALSVVSWQSPTAGPIKEKAISFKSFPELSLIISMVVIILGVGILTLYFFAGKFYLADINYKAGQRTIKTETLEEAVKLNPWRIDYILTEAQVYLLDALDEARKPATEQDSIKIQNYISRAIDKAKTASAVSPNKVGAWEILGMIYREITGLASGATQWGIKSFEKAIELEPTNPILHTELGKLLISEDAEKAKAEFEKAAELKPDYAGAQIQLALLMEKEDNLTGAIQKLEEVLERNIFDTEVIFQLGRLYYNNEQINESVGMFLQVIRLFPNHSNAHYSLGVAYNALGEKEKAIAEFEKVLELNPNNEDVKDKLESLR